MIYKMDEQSKVWDEIYSGLEIEYEELLRKDLRSLIIRMNDLDVSKILDLGCGYGHWSIILAKVGFDVVAADISKEAIEHLRSELENRDLDIRTEVIRADDIDSLEEEFDGVISNSVLDHMMLEDTKKVISKMENIMEKDGRAYLTFDCLEEESDYETLEDGTRMYKKGMKKGTLWRYYSEKEIKEICSQFDILELNELENGKREVWLRK